MLLTLEIVAYALSFWLGLYLLARNPANPRLRYAGIGLLAYAVSLASATLARFAPAPAGVMILTRLHAPMLFLPAFFWFATIIYLLPETSGARATLIRVWKFGLLPVAVPLYLLSVFANLVFDFSSGLPQPGPAYGVFAVAVLVPLLLALFFVAQTFRQATDKKPLALLLLASIFVALGAGLLTFPLEWLARSWLLFGVSLDFIILGLVIALLDAFDEGESLLPDIARSFDASLLFVLLFGGPVALTMALGTGVSFSMLVLLLVSISAAIASQTLADPLQSKLDALAFAAFPQLRQARAELRTTASILPRVDPSLEPAALDDAEFARLTRRALSNLGNLPRLATSPLTQLPLVRQRLAHRRAADDTLERAAELKQLLVEQIGLLKPPGDAAFGTSDAWRYYNALYFPYVVGLKPYSRRADHDGLDAAARQALDWFRAVVPERTLYNWQTAGARLIAQNLRERARAA